MRLNEEGRGKEMRNAYTIPFPPTLTLYITHVQVIIIIIIIIIIV